MPHPERGGQRPKYRTFLSAYEQAWQRYQQESKPQNLAALHAGAEILSRELAKPGRFELGQIVGTPGALEAMETAGHIPPEFLLRHKHSDWGELPEEDIAENERALRVGSRLFSVYMTLTVERLWVITEWDRSATRLLLPEEY